VRRTACGSFNPTTTYNEAQTTYTAPTAIHRRDVAVTVNVGTDPTKSATTASRSRQPARRWRTGVVFQIAGQPGPTRASIQACWWRTTARSRAGTGCGELPRSDDDGTTRTPCRRHYGGSYATTPMGTCRFDSAGCVWAGDADGTQRAGGRGSCGDRRNARDGTSICRRARRAPRRYALSLFGAYVWRRAWIGGANIDSAEDFGKRERTRRSGRAGGFDARIWWASTVPRGCVWAVTITAVSGTGSSLQPCIRRVHRGRNAHALIETGGWR